MLEGSGLAVEDLQAFCSMIHSRAGQILAVQDCVYQILLPGPIYNLWLPCFFAGGMEAYLRRNETWIHLMASLKAQIPNA